VKKSRLTGEQIAFALKQAELGTTVPEIFRVMRIADATFSNWNKKCVWRTRAFGAEAVTSVGGSESQAQASGGRAESRPVDVPGVVAKNALKALQRCVWVSQLQDRFGVSGRRVCKIMATLWTLFSYRRHYPN